MAAEEKQLFRTWNGKDRPAMWWGVPIMPLVGLILGGLLAFGFGTGVFNVWIGGLFAVPFIFTLCAFYYVSAIDDRYMRRVQFAVRRLLLSARYGRGLMIAPQNPKWSQHYVKRFALRRYVARSDDPTARVSRP